MFKKFKDSTYWKAALTLLACGCLLIVFNNWINKARIGAGLATVNKVLMPFYIGIILAFLLCPLYNTIVKWTYKQLSKEDIYYGSRINYYVEGKNDNTHEITPSERRTSLNISKALASVICLFLVVGLLSLMVYAIVPQVITSCVNLVDSMPERLSALSDWLSTNVSRFPGLAKQVDRLADQGTMKLIELINERVLNNDNQELVSSLSAGVVTAVSSLVNAFIGILIMVYLLNYKEKIFAICKKIMAASCRKKTKDNLLEFTSVVNDTFIGFIVGKVIDSIIIGILTYIVLLLFGISFAPMISLIVGVTNVIPVFGPYIGAIPSFLILMLESPQEAFLFLLLIFIIQQLDGNIIGPKCIGNAIGIDSFWVLVSVLIGGGLFGFAGMFFGVPVFAVIYRYIDKLAIRNLRKQDKPTHTADYISLESYGIDSSSIDLEDIKSEEKAFHKKFTKRKAPEEETVSAGEDTPKIENTMEKDAEKLDGEKSAREIAAERAADALDFHNEEQAEKEGK